MKCYICTVSDDKINMQEGKQIFRLINIFDFMPMKHQYFHRQCLQSVICEPQDYPEEMVNRALECHDYIMEQREHKRLVDKREKATARHLELRLGAAQDHLECLDEADSV